MELLTSDSGEIFLHRTALGCCRPSEDELELLERGLGDSVFSAEAVGIDNTLSLLSLKLTITHI